MIGRKFGFRQTREGGILKHGDLSRILKHPIPAIFVSASLSLALVLKNAFSASIVREELLSTWLLTMYALSSTDQSVSQSARACGAIDPLLLVRETVSRGLTIDYTCR